VVAFADVIDFLLRLLTDKNAQAEFDKDPQGALADAGLEGVTAADIRDARLQLADSGAVSGSDHDRGSSHGDDPVREIGYTTQHYVADERAVHHDGGHGGHGDMSLVARGDTFVTIDDRDTLFFQSISDDDVTIDQDNSVNNQLAIQDNDVNVSDNDTTINAEDSFNSDDDLVAIQDNDVNGGDEVIDIDVTGGVGADPDEPAAAPDAPDADLAAVSGPTELDTATDPGLDAEPDADLAAVSGPSELDPGIDPAIDEEPPVEEAADDADDAVSEDLTADDALPV
jgi:hypothetical protein